MVQLKKCSTHGQPWRAKAASLRYLGEHRQYQITCELPGTLYRCRRNRGLTEVPSPRPAHTHGIKPNNRVGSDTGILSLAWLKNACLIPSSPARKFRLWETNCRTRRWRTDKMRRAHFSKARPLYPQSVESQSSEHVVQAREVQPEEPQAAAKRGFRGSPTQRQQSIAIRTLPFALSTKKQPTVCLTCR